MDTTHFFFAILGIVSDIFCIDIWKLVCCTCTWYNLHSLRPGPAESCFDIIVNTSTKSTATVSVIYLLWVRLIVKVALVTINMFYRVHFPRSSVNIWTFLFVVRTYVRRSLQLYTLPVGYELNVLNIRSKFQVLKYRLITTDDRLVSYDLSVNIF